MSESLHDAFMRHIGVTTEAQQRIQRYYLPRFRPGGRLLDVACGDGDFVALASAEGFEAEGLDQDATTVARARALGRHVHRADAYVWLETHRAAYDGIFSAHFIEHLPHERALDFVRRSAHALRPGGRLVVTTPNVRGLYAHFEGFHLHYDHVRFYHPDLLAFYFAQAGFTEIETGENPELAHPLYADLKQVLGGVDEVAKLLVVPETANPLRRAWRAFKTRVMGSHPHVTASQIVTLQYVLGSLIDRLDRPVECFATGVAPGTG